LKYEYKIAFVVDGNTNVSDSVSVAATRRRRLDGKDSVGGQVRLELGVVDSSRLLDFTTVQSPELVGPFCSHDNSVVVGRHTDAVGAEASHVETDAESTAGGSDVWIVDVQRFHVGFVEHVGAAAASYNQRIGDHLVASPLHVAGIKPQELVPVTDMEHHNTLIPRTGSNVSPKKHQYDV